jgi:hypothetical protein
MELVTISNCKRTGDRSYSYGIWQIVGRNQSHVAVWAVRDDFWGPGGIAGREVQYLNTEEFDFFDAYPLLSAQDLKELLPHCKLGMEAKNPGYESVVINISA